VDKCAIRSSFRSSESRRVATDATFVRSPPRRPRVARKSGRAVLGTSLRTARPADHGRLFGRALHARPGRRLMDAPHHARHTRGRTGSGSGGACWARRKPTLLFRFHASFLFRFADRALCGLLFHEPPRSARRISTAYALRNTVPDTMASRKPAVSAWLACAIQLRSEMVTSSSAQRPSR